MTWSLSLSHHLDTSELWDLMSFSLGLGPWTEVLKNSKSKDAVEGWGASLIGQLTCDEEE